MALTLTDPLVTLLYDKLSNSDVLGYIPDGNKDRLINVMSFSLMMSTDPCFLNGLKRCVARSSGLVKDVL